MGGETPISEAAEKVSKEIFSTFLWNRSSLTNQNWDCVKKRQHNKTTHPSDVVFFYDEPYASHRTYVNCDLKSYGKGTITPYKIASAIKDLSLAIECAETSPSWQSNYQLEGHNAQVIGLLFVFNHDGDYDQDFNKIIQDIEEKDLSFPIKRRIFVLGPSEISYLSTVANDIAVLRGRGDDPIIPKSKDCSFFYPELQKSRLVRSEWSIAANLEMLTGPWIVMKTRSTQIIENYDSMIVYYREKGATRDEFIYLIDYLFAYQQTTFAKSIQVRLASPELSDNATSNFANALKYYGEIMKSSTDTLNKIKCEAVNTIIKKFNSKSIGMRDE